MTGGRKDGARARRGVDRWTVGGFVLAVILATPILAVLALAFAPLDDVWSHLYETVLARYVSNTFGLMVGVGSGTLLIGVGTAWLVTMCRFPGRRLFEWALLLPLAVPTYVIAYTYTDVLEYAGPLQRGLRAAFGWSSAADYWFPDIRTLGGAVVVMALVLYPYVYLLARSAFLAQSVGALEASRTLGYGPWRSFFTVALPLARPAIAAGVALALMETLNDFGTVDYFAVKTFTVGIYNTWLGMNSLSGAAQLASALLAFVLVLVGIERLGRRRQRFHETTVRHQVLPSFNLLRGRALAATLACAAPVVCGFVVPAAVLAVHAAENYEVTLSRNFFTYAWNSVLLSGTAAAVTVLAGLFLAYALRIRGGRPLSWAARLASVGYAVPGSVLAVGVIVVLGRLDGLVADVMSALFGSPPGLFIGGTLAAVVFAYVARFLALSFGALEAGLARVRPTIDDAARSLGATAVETLRRVHVPMIRGSVLTAALLVFVDGMKELPMTLLLRPFNFETLATFVYQYAGDERLEECALAALTVVAVGIGPVLLLSAAIRRSRPAEREG